MQTLTKTVLAYKYDELSETAKDAAINAMADINVDYEWWESTHEDAKTVGIKITSFDLDRGRNCKGEFIDTAVEVATKIIAEHGKDCETHKTATAFLKEYNAAWDAMEKDEDGEVSYKDEQVLEDIKAEFKQTILEDYSIILQREYEYQTSREQIEETIRANEYDFTVDGHFPAI